MNITLWEYDFGPEGAVCMTCSEEIDTDLYAVISWDDPDVGEVNCVPCSMTLRTLEVGA